ncbi:MULTISPECIES: LysE/ArgO family amino acid transporter [Aeromicrobium]|uniref:LysE/ArgO family amino acid transporter n=1 Tax=Aeromicrobium TaxID=2040 RepID=UPI00258105CC|nr:MULTISPECIES: LysE/ArgO family amino acid transporter [Aeromicrobium]
MVNPFLTGMVTGLSLIVVIGAQNAFVLRQGIRRAHVAVVVAICAVSDLVLILAGVAGIGAIVDRAGWVIDVVTWLGVAFLVWYGIGSIRRAFRPEQLEATGRAAGTVRTIALQALALTWLNPHVYLDTVVLLGSIAQTHGPVGRWWFGAGASVGSVAWFSALGFGATRLAPLLARPRAWQVLDLLIGLVMFVIAASLVW